ncbi:helix-turn-helix domain-containing protein [Apibacter adventoris]|uniref:helix-turn-helix domain-containing protein n=1 Tax=Apibacter adventoris TaxID=1679466 RepID=UPI000CF74B78|nr:helix-turn-helix transcriptional regulator [Apibacter adventoris]PQL94067.1 AraC family transcriptional regulator [Apibacter adventoris]
MDEILNLETIPQCNVYMGIETLHPLVTVVDFSEVKPLQNVKKNLGLYAIFLKIGDCGDIKYGRQYYDYQEGTLVFLAPGQVVGKENERKFYRSEGKALFFHPDLLNGTPLGKHIQSYTFFSYQVHEALHISEEEKGIFIECLNKIELELKNTTDKHSNSIIVSNIELLLNYCMRFYDRQFITRKRVNPDILIRFENLLNEYFLYEKPKKFGLPSVKYCAEQLHFSPNYFGDLIKKETGKSPQEYIQLKIINIAKERISYMNKTISEVAYELGFQHPSYFTRFFKKSVGYTPKEYRSNFN